MSKRPLAPTLRAVLLDVGGTLWPDGFPLPGAEGDHQVERVRRVLPDLSADLARSLIREVHARFGRRYERPDAPADLSQDTHGELVGALRALGLEPPAAGLDALRRALIVPASPDYLFPGARELLREVRRLGLRAVLVSNTYLRTGAEYLEDFERFGLRPLLDGAVTSVDVGLRKPHRAVFEAGLKVAGSPPEASVMVGNSERDDIAPARALGIRTVRVASGGPPPEGTEADALASGPAEVAAILRRWMEGAGAPEA